MDMFSLKGKNAVIIGGAGVLGTAMSKGLAQAGANIAICSRREESIQSALKEIKADGVKIKGYKVDASAKAELENFRTEVLKDFGQIDILVNAVGGNMKEASTSDTASFFDLPEDALNKVFHLNLMAGAILPSQVFGSEMIKNPDGGVIINISSMNAYRPLTRIPGYSAAKAAVSNFTQWLAAEMARKYGEKIRVNAIAPGFFLTEQNRFLMTDAATGEYTPRGKAVITNTPMGRFGKPEELIGTLIWMASDASKFVTGVVVPVDGGFTAFSGV